MKKGLLTLAVAIVVGVLAFFLTRAYLPTVKDPVLLDTLPELTWLRTDLKLTDEQFTKVEQLHRDYRPICDEMCRRIAESRANVAELANAQSDMNEDLTIAIDTHSRVMADCKRAMLEHIYKTASLMDESQAQRYLKITVPLALDSAHGRISTRNYE